MKRTGYFGLVNLTIEYKDVTHYWPQLKLGNIDPAFPGNSVCDRILCDLNFKKIIS